MSTPTKRTVLDDGRRATLREHLRVLGDTRTRKYRDKLASWIPLQLAP